MSFPVRILFLSLLILTGQASAFPTTPPDWQAIRDHQPPGMQLKLTFPKTHFFLGEEIPATLVFPYDSGNMPYGYQFFALDDQNKPLTDTMLEWDMNFDLWLFKHIYGTLKAPISNSLICSINQLYPFTHTGTYTIFVTTAPIYGTKPPANLVSDKLTITIDPRTPAEEQAILDEARAVFAKPNSSEKIHECNQLWFLATPAALTELAPFLEEGHSSLGCTAAFAFGVPADHKASAALLLACVKKGKPLLNPLVVEVYGYLKGEPDRSALTNPGGIVTSTEGLLDEPNITDSQREIIDAALEASGGTGPIAASAYWADLAIEPRSRAVQKEVAAHQMDLSLNDRHELVGLWSEQLRSGVQFPQGLYIGSEDIQVPWSSQVIPSELVDRSIMERPAVGIYSALLPAVKKTADAPDYDPDALELLCKVAPDQARPMVIADIKRDTSLFYNKPFAHYPTPVGVDALPDQPIPELTETFRQKLQKPNTEGAEDYLLTLVNRYGTPDLLPDVEQFYHRTLPEDQTYMECANQIAYRSFAIKCDPQAGLAALEKKIEARPVSGYNEWILQIFQDRWSDTDLPFLRTRLERETYPPALYRLVKLLSNHGDSSDMEPVVSALERISKQKYLAIEYEPTPETEKYEKVQLILDLIKNGHWDFSAGQRDRLNKLIALN